MATYVNDLRLKEIATGDESGTWGTSTNTNLSLIADAFSYATKDCFATDADATETMADGSADEIRSLYLKVTSSATLTATRTLTIAPNTVSKVWIIENATTGSQSISISQGSGANVTIPNGDVKVIYTDGAGATAAVTDAFANLKVTDPAQTNITSLGTLTGLDVAGTPTFDGLTVDGTVDVNFGSDGSNIVSLSGAAAGRNLNIQSFAVGASPGAGYSINATSGQGELDFQTTGTSRLNIDFGGDISFYEDTGTSPALFWDASAESLGIGTTSPSNLLHVVGASAGALDLARFRLEGATNNPMLKIEADEANATAGIDVSGSTATELTFSEGGIERMRITSTGRVGINDTSPDARLHVNGGTDNIVALVESTDATAKLGLKDNSTTNIYSVAIGAEGDEMTLSSGSGGSEAIRIDSSGNLLHGCTGTTGSDISDGGILLRSDSTNYMQISSGSTGDNDLILFYKKSGTGVAGVGSIGSEGGDLVLGTGTNCGIQFNDGNAAIRPFNMASYSPVDNAVDLGISTHRFKDLYLSNDINLLNNSQINFASTSCNIEGNSSGADFIKFTTAGSERMRMDSLGNLLVGKTSATFSVDGFTARNDGFSTSRTSGTVGDINRNGTDGNALVFYKAASSVGSISVTSSATAYNTSSDARLKEITGSARGLEVINALNPVSYNWKADGKADEGLIAQEVQEIVPNAVTQGEDGYYSMDYSKLVTHLVAGMKEQQTLIEQLQAEVALLKGE